MVLNRNIVMGICNLFKIWLICLVFFFIMLLSSCELVSSSWSPDSDKIALVWSYMIDGNDIFLLGETRVNKEDFLHFEPPTILDTICCGGYFSEPTWSPNTKYLAYYKIEPLTSIGVDKSKIRVNQKGITYDISLIVITLDTKDKKVLMRKRWFEENNFDERNIYENFRPAWSMDSKRIFYTDMLTPNKYSIESIDVNGKDTQRHMVSFTGTVYASSDGDCIGTLQKETLDLLNIDSEIKTHLDITSIQDPTSIKLSNNFRKLAFIESHRIGVIDVYSHTKNYINELKTSKINDLIFSSDGSIIFYIVTSKKNDLEVEQISFYRIYTSNFKKEELFSTSSMSNVRFFSASTNGEFLLIAGEQNMNTQKRILIKLYSTEKDKAFEITIGE